MKKKHEKNQAGEFEEALKGASGTTYVLRLYVTGSTPRSQRAIKNIKKICEEHLQGRYELEVIDVYQQPGLALEENIIAAPTLVKKLPAPLKKFIGDLSDMEKVLIGLNIAPKG